MNLRKPLVFALVIAGCGGSDPATPDDDAPGETAAPVETDSPVETGSPVETDSANVDCDPCTLGTSSLGACCL